MIQRLGVSIAVFLHALGTLIYFWRMANDPGHVYWHMYGWSLFFQTVQAIPLMLISFVCMNGSQCRFDKYFLLTEFIFTFILITCYILQYFEIMQRTHGLQISLTGLVIVSGMIIVSGCKNGYYKQHKNNG